MCSSQVFTHLYRFHKTAFDKNTKEKVRVEFTLKHKKVRFWEVKLRRVCGSHLFLYVRYLGLHTLQKYIATFILAPAVAIIITAKTKDETTQCNYFFFFKIAPASSS